jgi:hypothetical protein
VHNTQNYWVLDFAHHPEFQMLENTTFRKLDLFPPSGEARETPTLLGQSTLIQWLRLALSEGPNRVGVSFPSPEERNRFSFGNVSSSIWNSGRRAKSRNPVILRILLNDMQILSTHITINTLRFRYKAQLVNVVYGNNWFIMRGTR